MINNNSNILSATIAWVFGQEEHSLFLMFFEDSLFAFFNKYCLNGISFQGFVGVRDWLVDCPLAYLNFML